MIYELEALAGNNNFRIPISGVLGRGLAREESDSRTAIKIYWNGSLLIPGDAGFRLPLFQPGVNLN